MPDWCSAWPVCYLPLASLHCIEICFDLLHLVSCFHRWQVLWAVHSLSGCVFCCPQNDSWLYFEPCWASAGWTMTGLCDPNYSQWRWVSHSDTAGTWCLIPFTVLAFSSNSALLHLSFVDSTSVCAFCFFFDQRNCWHCLSYCFDGEGAPQGLDCFWTLSLCTSMVFFPVVPG